MSTNGHGNHQQNGRFSSTNDTMVGEFDDVEIDHYDDIIEENSQMYIFSPLLKLSQSLFQNDHGRRSAVKTTSAISEASRLFNSTK